MSNIVISVENLSKSYRLGQIGTGTLSRDLEVWWAKVRGKPNPLLKIGQEGYGETGDRRPKTGLPSPVSRLSTPSSVSRPPSDILWALRDVSFQVQQGEVLGIIGRNGAGKSTLLKILSRVTAPTSGQVKVKGRIASLLEVGTGFHPELTGRENIFLNGAILGMSRQEVQRKFDEIVSFAEVEKFVDTPVKRYSSGMYVRLAFAVAAHLESEILLVDEVLAVGDAEFQKKCIGKMGEVSSNEGRTVLFVSHNMASVLQLCRSCVLINNGQIIAKGKSDSIIEKYLNEKHYSIEPKEDFGKYIKSLRIVDENNIEKKHFDIAEKIIIEVFIDTNEESFNNAVIGIGINSLLGERIATVGTYFSKSKITLTKGLNIVRCTINNANIAPGDYLLKIALGNNLQNDIESVDNVTGFTIIPSDYFKNGRLPNNKQGIVLLRSDWKLFNDQY